MDILVTGCAGFIGFHLTKRLLKQGHSVTGVDNLNDYYDPELKLARLEQLGVCDGAVEGRFGDFTFIKGGIEDVATFDALERFDVVCHLAAQAGVRYSISNPSEYITSNLVGFFNMLEYCRRTKPDRFVFASSSSVYGNSADVPYRESNRTDSPTSLYAATKMSNELMAHTYANLYDINAIGLRFFTVYGAWGRPDMAPYLFTSAILEGREIEVFNNGDMSRDFTYVDDVVEGIYRVLTQEPAVAAAEKMRIYNIGNSKPTGLEEFISTIELVVGRSAKKVYKPMQMGDVKMTYADVSLLERDYGYRPATSLEDGLRVFVEWYRRFHAVPAGTPKCLPTHGIR